MNKVHKRGGVEARLCRVLFAALGVCLWGLAVAQDPMAVALRHTYGAPTLTAQGSDSRFSAHTSYLAAAFDTRRGPEIVIVRSEAGSPPIPTFRLSASLQDDEMPLRDAPQLSRYRVDRLEFVSHWENFESLGAWAIARLTCACSDQVVYLAIDPIAQLNLSEVTVLTLDERRAPYLIDELPQGPSPVRSLLGLAATDGLVRLSPEANPEPLPTSRWHGNFVPDPRADCVACAPNYRDHDPISIYLARHYGSTDYSIRLPEFRRGTSRFVVRLVHPFDRLTDTVLLHEQNGRVAVLYQYSEVVIQGLSEPTPNLVGFLNPSHLVDLNGDNYPELVGSEAWHCGLDQIYYAVIDVKNREAVFIEYTGGPSWDPNAPATRVPYIRPLANPSSSQAQMETELLDFLNRNSVERAREPADSVPLGLTNDVRASQLNLLR